VKSTIASIDKRRNAPKQATALHLIGDVRGKTAIIIDAMIDTAGTLGVAIEHLIKEGAKEVYAMATHAVCSGPAIERIEQSPLKEFWVTDTIPLRKKSDKIHCVSVSPLIAEAIKRIDSKGSVSLLFD